MKKLVKVFLITLILSPSLVYAQLGGVRTLLSEAEMIIYRLIILLGGVALLVFFWGLVKFIAAQGSETAKADAKKIMGWGLIALFVMISVWGIVNFIQLALLGSTSFPNPVMPNVIN